ncbi:MAG: hypothetical protein M1548_00665 [Actinobacteria bacterium]|nr:hypothetical protein [Actinomycetota bacterium]
MRKKAVRKTAKMRLIEERFGRPVEALLRDLYRTQTMKQITEHLKKSGVGVSVGTLSIWFLKLGIETRRWTHPEEFEEGGAGKNDR